VKDDACRFSFRFEAEAIASGSTPACLAPVERSARPPRIAALAHHADRGEKKQDYGQSSACQQPRAVECGEPGHHDAPHEATPVERQLD
jgi:hypothetical protein